MSKVGKDLDDLLLHYGVKGMKWRNSRSESEDQTNGGEGDEADDDLDKKLEDVKGKVGDGPLDMLKYILFGKPKKRSKSSGPKTLDKVGKQLKDLKSKVGRNPLDMLKYIFFGKRHSALTDEVTLGDVRPYVESGQKVFESLLQEELLQQSGVLGMKWGVRRDRNRPGGADGKKDAKDKPIRTSLGKKWDSLKRERQWKTVLKEMDQLSTKELTVVAKRVSLENSLKTLSRSKIGTKKDKEDYLRREHMDDEELSRKVTRLKVKESLHNAVHAASKEQREFGQKVAQIGGSLSVRYVMNKRLSTQDIFDVVKNPKGSADKAKKDVLNVALAKLKTKSAT